jgi:hypothetical protein
MGQLDDREQRTLAHIATAAQAGKAIANFDHSLELLVQGVGPIAIVLVAQCEDPCLRLTHNTRKLSRHAMPCISTPRTAASEGILGKHGSMLLAYVQ